MGLLYYGWIRYTHLLSEQNVLIIIPFRVLLIISTTGARERSVTCNSQIERQLHIHTVHVAFWLCQDLQALVFITSLLPSFKSVLIIASLWRIGKASICWQWLIMPKDFKMICSQRISSKQYKSNQTNAQHQNEYVSWILVVNLRQAHTYRQTYKWGHYARDELQTYITE